MPNKLFAVYVGGKSSRTRIEMHDLVFTVGSSVRATFPQLREAWFGEPATLHVDSWVDLSEVDGYRIVLRETKNKSRGPKLYYTNVGFYRADAFGEQHRFDFFVAANQAEAKIRALKACLPDDQLKHIDNVASIDDLAVIKTAQGLYVTLEPGDGLFPLEINNVYWPVKANI